MEIVWKYQCSRTADLCGSSDAYHPWGCEAAGKRCVSTGDRTEKKVFRRLTLASDKMEKAQNFLLQYGLTGHVLRMDYLRSWQTLSELVPGKWSDFPGGKKMFR